MDRTIVAFAAALLAAGAGRAQPPATAPGHAHAPHYTTAGTDIGTLLADPAAKAVVARYVPGFADDPRVAMASGMTLAKVAPMSPEPISEATLAKIDADLAKLPAKH